MSVAKGTTNRNLLYNLVSYNNKFKKNNNFAPYNLAQII